MNETVWVKIKIQGILALSKSTYQRRQLGNVPKTRQGNVISHHALALCHHAAHASFNI